MKQYRVGEEVTIWRRMRLKNINDPTQTILYNFADVYGAVPLIPLNDITKGLYTFTMEDSSAVPATITIGGVARIANDLPMLLHSSPVEFPNDALFIYNVPAIPGIYTCKTQFTLPNGENASTMEWQVKIEV